MGLDSLPSYDPSLFDPNAINNQVQPLIAGGNTGSTGTDAGLPTPGITELLGEGFQGAAGLIRIIGQIIPVLEQDLAAGLGDVLVPALGGLLGNLPRVASSIDMNAFNTWQWLSDHSVGALYKDMLHLGLGVDTDLFDDQARKGVETVDTMLGFAALMPLVGAALGLAGKIPMAGRFADVAGELLGKLAEEMGLSWAMGLQIDEAFKVAVGMSIEEGINRQKRGNRIGWQQLRLLLTQHKLAGLTIDSKGKLSGSVTIDKSAPGTDVMRGLLMNQGFPDEQIDLLLAMVDAQLPIGDLQQLYLRGEMTADEVETYISQLGFNDTDKKRLRTMYIDAAETEASTTLRTTARSLYTNQLITEDQYRTILTGAHFPQKEVDDDVAAVNLVQTAGRLQETAATIKARFQRNLISPQEAQQELSRLNYPANYINDLIALWQAQEHPKPHGLTQGQVLSYLASGVLKPQDAYQRLLELGVVAGDAQFLVQNPRTGTGARRYRLTPALIQQAYIAGAITQDQIEGLLTQAGVPQETLNDYYQHILYAYAHALHTNVPQRMLDKAEILSGWQYGIIHQTDAINDLVALGYSEGDALILMEIKNKGQFLPPSGYQPPTFAEASAYLLSQGYQLVPPPDPQLIEAEMVVEQAGYSFIAPTTPLPPINQPPLPSGGAPA